MELTEDGPTGPQKCSIYKGGRVHDVHTTPWRPGPTGHIKILGNELYELELLASMYQGIHTGFVAVSERIVSESQIHAHLTYTLR